MKIKYFLLPLILSTSNGHSTDLFFSAGASITNDNACSATLSNDIAVGINLTDQFASKITYSNLGECEYYLDNSYTTYVNELTFLMHMASSDTFQLFFEGGYGYYKWTDDGFSGSDSTPILGTGMSIKINDSWSWQARLKVYDIEETVLNLGASLTYNF